MGAVDFLELSASILQPYYDVVRHAFVDGLEDGFALGGRAAIRRTQLVVEPRAREGARHYAGTNESGSVILAAPEMIELDETHILAIFAHEFGHATDFAYPGWFTWPRQRAGKSLFVGGSSAERAAAWRGVFGKARAVSRRDEDHERPAVNWMRAWQDRSADEVEWAADGIAELVTGKRIGYCGPCKLQCLDDKAPRRPRGLR